MGAILYLNSKGRPVTTHSYSGGSTFRKCARLYQLERLRGYKDRKHNAALEFGKTIENALQYYFVTGGKPGSAVDDFKAGWLGWEHAALDYTDREGDWKDLYTMGSQMMALFEVKWPSLGVSSPRFQQSFRKTVFPGTELSDIDYIAYIDMLADTPDGEQVVIDIKTGAAALDETPGMLQLDPQLRRYAWVSGVPHVAFLQFIKTSPGMKKGDSVTALSGSWTGELMTVVNVDEAGRVTAVMPSKFDAYKEESKGVRGKAAEALAKLLVDECGVIFGPDQVTKQRLQYLKATIAPQDIQDTGDIVGREIVEIAQTNISGTWYQNPGVRWPNNTCCFCSMRGECLNNPALSKELIIKPGEPEGDWLDELERE